MGTLELNGASIGTLSGPITIQTGAVLDYGQGGTLAGGQVTGTGTATLNFTAAVTLTGPYTFSGITQIQGGTVSFDGATTIASLNLTGGTLGGTAAVTISGEMTWTGGSVTDTGGLTIAKTATLTIDLNANTSIYLTGATLTNLGAVVQEQPQLSGLAFYVQSKGVINNSGTWTVLTDLNMIDADGSAVVFNNTGSFVKGAGTETSTWSVPITGAGAINVEMGTLALTGTSIGTLTGPITIQTGAVLDYGQGGTLAGGQVTGTGTLNFTAGVTLTGPYTFSGITQIQGGTVSFDGATTIASLNLTGGTLGGTAAVTVSGEMTWTGGSVTDTGGLTIAKTATLTIDLNANTSIYLTGATLTNLGTVVQEQPQLSGLAFYVQSK